MTVVRHKTRPHRGSRTRVAVTSGMWSEDHEVVDTGGNFNGGTITEPLVAKAGIEVSDNGLNEVFSVAPDGSFRVGLLGSNANIELSIGGGIQLTDASDGTLVTIDNSGWLYLGSGATVGVSPDGWFYIESLGTVPDDADIPGSSGMIIFLDRTAGSPKLKIKAKDVNGDVFVGELPLAPV